MAHQVNRNTFGWLVLLMLAIQTAMSQSTFKDCFIIMPRAPVPTQRFVKNKDQSITVKISTFSDPIIITGDACQKEPPKIETRITTQQYDDPDIRWMDDEMTSSTFNQDQGALTINIKTGKLSSSNSPNFAVYVTVQQINNVKNTICFGIYRYEDETLNEYSLQPQKDICIDIHCKITFDAPVSRILSPSDSATVSLATVSNTIKSTGKFCQHSWKVQTFARDKDEKPVLDYVTLVYPSYGRNYQSQVGSSGKQEIYDLQVTVEPQNSAQRDQSVAVYVQLHDLASNLALGWLCFMVNKDAGDNSNFCIQNYCDQYDKVVPFSPFLHQHLGTYFVSLRTPIKTNFLYYGYRTLQPMGCPLTHEITSTNLNAQATAYIQPINSLGVFYIKTTQNDNNALTLNGEVSFVLKVKNYAGVTKATRSLQLVYAGCGSATIDYNELQTTNLKFYVENIASSFTSQQKTFYMGFTTSDPRCLLTFTKHSESDPLLDNIIQVDFKNSLKEQGYYFNMTLKQEPFSSASYVDKNITFSITAKNEKDLEKTVKFNMLFLSCTSLTNCKSCSGKLSADLNSNVRYRTIGCHECSPNYSGYLYDDSGLITRGCKQNQQQNQDWAPAGWGKVNIKNDRTGVFVVKDCSEAYKNCQLCSGFGQCLRCDSGFNKQTFLYPTKVDLCLKNLCFNCTSKFSNCQVYDTENQQCQQCSPGFYFPDVKRSSCKQRDQTSSYTENLFVQSYSGDLHKDKAIKIKETRFHREEYQVGKTMDNPFFFLGEVLSYLNSGMPSSAESKIAEVHNSVNVNVYLGKGDHHLFFCPNENLDEQEDACFYVDYLAQWFALFKYPITDNIAVTYQPLFCSNKTQWTSLTEKQNTWFDTNCVAEGTMPVVHVSKGYPMTAYFNITNSATFSNIRFNGLQQLQQPGLQTKKLFFTPNIYCKVSAAEEPDGSNRKLGVVSSKPNDLTCADVNFKGDIILEPSCITIEDQNVRFDKSQFYQDNYFKLARDKSYFIDRVKTLFNLYGFSKMKSTSTKIPSLTIKDCVFEYFFDYTALIFVETNQFSFIGDNTFVKQGLDRGFNIQMTGTTVRYSRFLKGTLFYKYDQIVRSGGVELYIKNQKQMQFQYFEEQYLHPAVVLTGTQQLIVQNCNFTLLNYGQTEQSLALSSKPERTVIKHFTSFSPAVQFTTYYSNGIGIVLNLQGFQGLIKVSNNVFTKNMIFFKPQITKKWKIITEGFSLKDMMNDQLNRVMLQKCDSYLFNDKLKSYIDHPDQLLFQLEAQSTVLIAFTQKLVVFDNNTFTDNIGFMGGAIMIDSPNFAANGAKFSSYATPDLRPNIIIYKNTFERNMAYSSGNAVYMRSTVEMTDNNYICGLVHIELNTFLRNIAVTKSHNGGAITLACDFSNSKDVERYKFLSEFQPGNDSAAQLRIYDKIDPNTSYQTYQYGSGIVNNNFTENVSGQKGTAIFARNIDNLFIEQNTFLRNQPLYSFLESEFQSPLWKYYFLKTRLASWDVFKTKRQEPATNEFRYFQVKDDDQEYIELPQVQGALYISICENCYAFYEVYDCQECRKLYKAYNLVKNNTFIDNQSGVTFSEAQKMKKSSQIQIFGGANSEIVNNTFSNVGSIYYERVKSEVVDFMNSLPPDYFKYQNAPLIRVTIPKMPPGKSSLVNFRNNIFQNNTGYQQFTSDGMFSGFLIDYDSIDTLSSTFVFESNQVRYCRVFGLQVSLISVTGGLTAKNNEFYRIGALQTKDFQRTATVTANFKPANLDNNYIMSTQIGVFSLKQPKLVQTWHKSPVYQNIIANDFSNIFCIKACVFYKVSDDDVHPSVLILEGNTYKNILAKSQAISITLASNTKTLQRISVFIYMVHIITNEIYEDVQNELHFIEGNLNKVVQIYNNVQSTNNFGQDSLITSYTTDAIFMRDSVFTHNTPYMSRFAAIEASLQKSKQKTDAELDFQFKGTFYDAETKKWFINIKQNNGVIKMKDNQNQIKSQNDFYYLNYTLYKNETVFNYIINQHELKSLSSNFLNSTFTGHLGKQNSLFDFQNAVLSMKYSRFSQNTAFSKNNGHTFKLQNCSFNGTGLVFANNKASNAGGILLKGGSYNIQNSSFIKNEASESAGAIEVINSNLVLNWTIFDQNTADYDSAISFFKCDQNPVLVHNSIFINNRAQKRLSSAVDSKLNLYNVTFTDNMSQMITSGIQIDNSDVVAKYITVKNTQADTNSAVISGFLFLSSNSQVKILKGVFQNLYGEKAAAILAQSQSKLYIEDSTFTSNLISQSNSGIRGTIVANQCISVTIVGCKFTSNNNVNINSYETALVITGSKFDDKQSASDSYVQIFSQSLQVSNSEFQSSNSNLTQGCGIFGDSLLNFQIAGCVFQNLNANRGGAIFLKSSNNGELISNSFEDNSATQGGAVYLQASNAQVRANSFYKNSVKALPTKNKNKSISKSEGAGGAIYFTCVDLDEDILFQKLDYQTQEKCKMILDGNQFKFNKAQNKGGAVFLANKNFTQGSKNPNIFHDNTATYGNIIGYAPHKLKIQTIQTRFLQPDLKIKQMFGLRLDNAEYFWQIVSGGLFNFNVTILDSLQEQYLDDQISSASLVFENGSLGTIRKGWVVANKGKYEFVNVEVRMKPNSTAILNLKVNGLTNYNNDISFIESPLQIYIYARPCQAGEIQTQNQPQTCKECEQGQYLLVPQTKEKQCQPCFPNAICHGGNKVSPKKGYYFFDVLTPVVVKCANFDACLGGNQTVIHGTCEAGYFGALCAQCSPGYYQRINAFVCFECFETWAEILIWIASLAFCIGVVVWIQKQFIRNFQNAGNVTLAVFKITVSHMQMIMMLSKLGEFSTTSFTEIFLRAKVLLLEVFLDIILPKCFLQSLDGETRFYVQVALMAVLPVLLFGVSYLFWLVYTKTEKEEQEEKEKKEKNEKKTFRRAVSTASLLMFIYYPFIIEYLLSSVQYINSQKENRDPLATQPSESVQRLKVRPEIEFLRGNHSWFMWVVSIPGIIMWFIAFPVLLLLKMRKNQNLIVRNYQPLDEININNAHQKTPENSDKKDQDSTQTDISLQSIGDAKSRYGLLFSDFKLMIPQTQLKEQSQDKDQPKFKKIAKMIMSVFSRRGLEIQHPQYPKQMVNSFYYWELLIYLRKIVICLVVILGRSLEPQIHLNLMLVIFVVFAIIQFSARPYLQDQANKLELLSLAVCFCIVYIRIVMLSADFKFKIDHQTIDMFGRGQSDDSSNKTQLNFQNETSFLSIFSKLSVVAPTLLFDFIWLKSMRNELLGYLADQKTQTCDKLFKILTFGQKTVEDYKQKIGIIEEDKPLETSMNSQEDQGWGSQGQSDPMQDNKAGLPDQVVTEHSEQNIDFGQDNKFEERQKKFIDDSVGMQAKFQISSARKSIQPSNQFRYQSDKSSNRPFIEDSQSFQQVQLELRSQKGKAEIGGTSEIFSQSNSIMTNPIDKQIKLQIQGGRSVMLNTVAENLRNQSAQIGLTNQLREEHSIIEPKNSYDLMSNELSPDRKRDSLIMKEKPYATPKK